MLQSMIKFANFAFYFEFTNIQIDEYKNIAVRGLQSKRHHFSRLGTQGN
jgi:hypothetical protein